ncbi:hypothetical protein M2447_001011 [Ereboglobus sp. PH5-10]|uniref:hypothetical protein n=1 Tax=Ereboglobus sp. PH5-10 TaxID=2940629 RepID=UPI002406A86C|nr:hypothetical protein [Ereboglobus sp. PH5-10]MDF9826926.1 hypothetical protein [Ereboglobus sp. PH5-10]
MNKILCAVAGYMVVVMLMVSSANGESAAAGASDENTAITRQLLAPIKISNQDGVMKIRRRVFYTQASYMKEKDGVFALETEYNDRDERTKLLFIKNGREAVVDTIKSRHDRAPSGVDDVDTFMDYYLIGNRIHYIYRSGGRVYVSYADDAGDGQIIRWGDRLEIGQRLHTGRLKFTAPYGKYPLSIFVGFSSSFQKTGLKVYELDDYSNSFKLSQAILKDDGTPEGRVVYQRIWDRMRNSPVVKKEPLPDDTVWERKKGFFPNKVFLLLGYPCPEKRPASFLFDEKQTANEHRSRLLFVENGRETIIDSHTAALNPDDARKIFFDCYMAGSRLHYIYYVHGNYYVSYADRAEGGHFKKSDNALCLGSWQTLFTHNPEFQSPKNGRPLSIILRDQHGFLFYELNNQNEFEFKRTINREGNTPEEKEFLREFWTEYNRRYLGMGRWADVEKAPASAIPPAET